MPTLVRPVTPLELVLIALVIAAGFFLFVRIAWAARDKSWTFSSFFLGGRQIGPTLTEHSTWGLTFAWSNGVWFFAVLAYQFGPRTILLQLPWCFSVCLVAALLIPIMRAAGIGTIHGFLGRTYGSSARVVACFATSVGYIFNCGFEMYWAGRMFALSIGYHSLVLPIALLFAGVCGAYCMIGGYLANCRTDKGQTILGMVSLTLLVLLAGATVTSPAVSFAVWGLAIICALYVALALAVRRLRLKTGSRLLNIAAILSLPLGVIFIAYIERLDVASVNAPQLFASAQPPTLLIVGIVVFQIFFNPVDMSNWQTVAANGDVPKSLHRELRWSIIRSAIYMIWFPAIAGILLGCIARVHSGLDDNGIFPAVFGMVGAHSSELFRGLIFGIIFLGLVSTSLSSSDTYIMAAAQTLSWDLFLSRSFDRISGLSDMNERLKLEAEYVERVRSAVLPLSIGMVLIFAACYAMWPSNVIAFQFIMYGSALSLFGPVVYGLWMQRRNSAPTKAAKVAATAAIMSGILAGLLPFVITTISSGKDISILSPIFSLVTSSVVFLTGLAFSHFLRPESAHG